MNEDHAIDLAGDRCIRVRRKWTQEGRPPEHMARMMIAHGCYWLADLKGEMTAAAVLEMWADAIRKEIADAPIAQPKPPVTWWSKLFGKDR
jgi:hypothetical protein